MLEPYTVRWKQVAEDALTQAWFEQADYRDLLSEAIDRIDGLLRSRPDTLGEERNERTRVYIEGNRELGCIILFFEVDAGKKTVEVIQFRFRVDGFSSS